MPIRAISICRKCAEVFLPEDGCPCEGGISAAAHRVRAPAPRLDVAEEALEAASSTPREQRAMRVSAAFLGVALFAALLLILAALTQAA